MFSGSMPALVTPFRGGELDIETLKKLVEWHVGEGSNGLVPVGTTGESPTLTHREHETVVEEVVKAAAGRIPVIAGAGSNNTLESIRLAQHARKGGRGRDAGGDALLQQADAARADRAFHRRARLLRPADHHLQHPAALGRGHDARHDGPAGETAADRGREGRDRRSGAGQRAADHLRARFHPAVGRGRHRARVQRAGRRRLHLRHRERRAKALCAVAGGRARRAITRPRWRFRTS